MQYYTAQLTAEEEMLSALFSALNNAERAREREQRSAERIGSQWKSFKQRRLFSKKKVGIVTIQRLFRGHKGRLRAETHQIQRKLRERALLFDHYATAIQRLFRGYYARKWVSDHSVRKAYLETVLLKSTEVREACARHHAAQVEEQQTRDKDEYFETFTKISSQMLYTASTACMPGVLSSKTIAPCLRASFGDTAEAALRVHRQKIKTSTRGQPPPKTDLSKSMVQSKITAKYAKTADERYGEKVEGGGKWYFNDVGE